MSINLLRISNVKRVILSIAIGLLLIGASTTARANVMAYYYSNASGSRYGAFGTIDLDTGAITVIKSNTVLGDAIGFGVVGGNLYTAFRADTKLYSIDPTNGNTTLKGSLSSGNGYAALGSTSDGLFAYLVGSKFATINPSDGSAVVKPTPPYTGVGGGMFPVWSTSSDSTTLSEYNSGTGEYGRYFGTINTSTGLGTLKNAALGSNIHLDVGGVRAMFEQGGTLYAIVQIGNQVMQGSTVGNLQAYTIDANGNATRYGTWAISSPDWNVQALAPVASVTVNIGSTALQYYPLPRPVRLLDTRPGETTACNNPGTPLTGGTPLPLLARAACQGVTIPANAQAVVGNAAVVNSISGSGPGYITLYPSDAVQPLAANLNYTANDVRSNAFTVGLGGDGTFDIFASTTTHFVVDITGYYAPPGAGGLYYHPLPIPCGGSTPGRVKPPPAPTPARRSRLVCP